MTIDVHKIPLKAFGLLSKEEQEALKRHSCLPRKKVEIFGASGAWTNKLDHFPFHPEFTYRAAPEPQRPISCTLPGVSIWELFDESVKSIARDQIGDVYTYLNVAKKGMNSWYGVLPKVVPERFTTIDPGNMPWDESLIVRPGWEGE
jgi:hypothetical protein